MGRAAHAAIRWKKKMSCQTVRVRPNIQRAATHRALQAAEGHHITRRGLYEERVWRCPGAIDERPREQDILISRWIDRRSLRRCENAVSPSERYVIGVALKTTRLKFMRGPHTIYDGIMPAGTLHVTGPGQLLTAEFFEPCDFIHFHVSSDYLRDRQDAAGVEPTKATSNLNDLIIRDPLAELLGRTLVEDNNTSDECYVDSVGQTLVMHIARMELSPPTTNALPKWRLKRVQDYVEAHSDKALTLRISPRLQDCRGCISLDSFELRPDCVPTIICSINASNARSPYYQARIWGWQRWRLRSVSRLNLISRPSSNASLAKAQRAGGLLSGANAKFPPRLWPGKNRAAPKCHVLLQLGPASE